MCDSCNPCSEFCENRDSGTSILISEFKVALYRRICWQMRDTIWPAYIRWTDPSVRRQKCCQEKKAVEKIKVTEAEYHPLCPHCERKLSEVHWHKIKGNSMSLGYVAIYSCPHCRKVLGHTASGH